MAMRLVLAAARAVVPAARHAAVAIRTQSSFPAPHLPVRDTFSPLTISDVTFVPGSSKRRRIIGRGDGSTRGNKCGRGNKGQKARSKGPRPRVAYSGGQYPFYLYPPKLERPKCPLIRATAKLSILTLGRLQQWIDAGRLDPSRTITMHELVKSGLISKSCIRRNGVRIVDENAHLLRSAVNIEVTQFAPLAAHAIEQCGGKAVAVWFKMDNLRALILPEKTRLFPPRTHPELPVFVDYYADSKNRGYLALGVEPTYPSPASEFFRGMKSPVMATDTGGKPLQYTRKLYELVAGRIPHISSEQAN